MRMNICEPVATPRSFQATVPWIDTRKVVLQNPMPMPISSEPVVGHSTSPAGSSNTNTALPAINEAPPIAALSR